MLVLNLCALESHKTYSLSIALTDCSKACQTKAWKAHKRTCSAKHANTMDRNETTNSAMGSAFLDNNYMEIMMELMEITREHGIPMQDVVLELDFMGNGINPGPATTDKFKLDTVENYTTGDRPAKPAWNNVPVDKILSDLAKCHRMSTGVMWGIVRHADGFASIFSTPQNTTWSNEALACFPLFAEENRARFKSIVKWEDPSLVDWHWIRYIHFKLGDRAGLDRQNSYDFFTQLEILRQKKANGGN